MLDDSIEGMHHQPRHFPPLPSASSPDSASSSPTAAMGTASSPPDDGLGSSAYQPLRICLPPIVQNGRFAGSLLNGEILGCLFEWTFCCLFAVGTPSSKEYLQQSLKQHPIEGKHTFTFLTRDACSIKRVQFR